MDKSRRDLLTLGMAVTAGSLIGCGREASSRTPSPAESPKTAPPPLPPPIPAGNYARRREQVAEKMRREGIDALLVTPSSYLLYLTGADLGRSERLIAWVLRRDGGSRCLGPAFEADRLKGSGLPGELKTWEESEDPIAALARILSEGGRTSILAVEGTTWLDNLAPLERRLPAARITSATPLLAPFRMKKDPEEIALIRAGAGRTLGIFRRLFEEMKEGQTEEELLRRAQAMALESGLLLEGLVQFGPDSAIPHSPAGSAKLRAGDVVLFDMGVLVHGYHSDVSRTVAFGRPPEKFQPVYEIVKEAQEAGFRAARSGIPASMVDEAARSVIRRAGYARAFTHRLGHGLGLDGHEPPYLVAGNETLLEAGMTVTVEPGIYLPREFGVRLEDDVAVTPSGGELLSVETPA